MTTKTTNLAEVEAEYAAAQARLQEVQRKAEQARAEGNRRQVKRREQHDRNLVAVDVPALTRDVREAESRLKEAILADPVAAAALDVMVARTKRYEAMADALSAAQRLGLERPFPQNPELPDLPLAEVIQRTLNVEHGNRAADEMDRRQGELEAALRGDSKTAS